MLGASVWFYFLWVVFNVFQGSNIQYIQQYKSTFQVKIYKQKLYNNIQPTQMTSKPHPFPTNPHNPTITHPPISSSFPRTYTITTKTRQQQKRIQNGLEWRKKTSMPIIKVLNFTSQKVQHQNGTHTTFFKVQMEQIVKPITDLRNLDISCVVYLIREILLGIQTLSIKYNCQFETSRAFFGVNDKGQAKVWFSDNFVNQYVENVGKSMSFSVNKVNSVVERVFEIVGRTLKHSHKATLFQIGSFIYKQQHTTFAEVQNKFRKICAQYKILVPNCISLPLENNNQNKRALISTQKKFRKAMPVLKQYGINLKNISTKTINHQQLLHHQATTNTSKLNSPKTEQHHIYTEQRVQAASSKPKINWRYTNSAHANQQSINESIMNNQQVYRIETVNNSINRNSVANSLHGSAHKQIILCRSVPIKIDTQRMNSEQRRVLGKQVFREDITIKQFNPLEEEDHSLEVSRETEQKTQTNVIENSNVYTLKSVKTAETKNQDESKISFEGCSSVIENFNAKKSNATTNVSNNTLRGKDSVQQFKDKCYNVNRLEEMIDNTKTVVNSIMIPSPLESRQAPVSSRTYYNFGGIIPIQINNGIEIDGKETESLQASRDVELKQSIQIKQQKKSKIDFDLLGGIDLMAKFYATDAKDLKESVWCGEEKKAEHLHIKLQKLGKIGREICASFVPNE